MPLILRLVVFWLAEFRLVIPAFSILVLVILTLATAWLNVAVPIAMLLTLITSALTCPLWRSVKVNVTPIPSWPNMYG